MTIAGYSREVADFAWRFSKLNNFSFHSDLSTKGAT
jgi:hypothetical protein